MTKQIINVGSAEQSGDGESIRSAFIKINENFDELYEQTSGPAGSQGIQGLQGSQGLAGTGSQGIQGITGVGTQGVQGVTGNQGVQGSQGIQGITGVGTQGVQGITGTPGTNGTNGAPGRDGIDGAPGQNGLNGINGTNGTNGSKGDKGDTGDQGVSVTLQGTKALIADLPAAPVNPADYAGHGWIVTEGGGNLWVWNLIDSAWNNVGPIVGPKGDKGDSGDPGAKGDPGENGLNGLDGRSAYELAVLGGFTGTQAEWLQSLVGQTGAAGQDGAPGADGLNGIDGAPGPQGDPGANGADALWNWQGTYSDAPQYQEGDIVAYNGSTYRRNGFGNSVTGFHPTDVTYWEIVSERGADGAPGADGVDGVDANPDAVVNGLVNITLNATGDFIPGTDNLQDLGSPTNRFRHLYVGPGSVTIGSSVITESTTGKLVLPGVTRATTLFANEVEDVEDQTRTWSTGPYLLDAYQFGVASGMISPGPSYAPAEYVIDAIDDDGYIDGITIDPTGTWTQDVADYNRANRMYAYIGTNIQEPFNPANWVQIPFIVRAKANDVEYEFNTGNANTGDINFNDTTIYAPDGDTIRIEVGDEDEVLRAYLKLDPNNGLAEMRARGNYQTAAFSGGWSSAVWTSDGGEGGQLAFNGANDLQAFLDDNLSGAVDITISVNEGEFIEYYGWSGGGGSITFFNYAPPPTSPTTITDIEFRYYRESRIEINSDDDELTIYGDGLDINIESTSGIRLDSPGSIVILSDGITGIDANGTNLKLYANNNYIEWDGANFDLKLPAGSDIVRDDGTGTFVSVLGGNANTGDITFDNSDIGSETSGNFVNLDVDGEEWMRLGTLGNEKLQLITNYANEGGNVWEFGTDGWLSFPGTFPSGAIGYDSDTQTLQLARTGGVSLYTQAGAWVFGPDGSITFPDDTVQTTAYTGGSGSSTVVRQDTAPTAANGTLWFNTVEGRLYIKYNDQWVDGSPTVLSPPDTNPTLESITFNDATVQSTAWTGTLSYNDLTDKPVTPAFVGGGGASTWLTAE